MKDEEDHIIAHLSDPELLLWHAKFGMDRLNRRQVDRIGLLLHEVREELAPPRRMSPEEWQRLKNPPVEDERRVKASA